MISTKRLIEKANSEILRLGKEQFYSTYLYDFDGIEEILDELQDYKKEELERLLFDFKNENEACKYLYELILQNINNDLSSISIGDNYDDEFSEPNNTFNKELLSNNKTNPTVVDVNRMFDSLFKDRIVDFEKKMNPILLNQLKLEIPSMSIDDYNTLLFFLNNLRK